MLPYFYIKWIQSFYKHSTHAFTLIELLLVIGIIAILASIVIISVNPLKQHEDAFSIAATSQKNSVEKALQQYLIDYGTFPDVITTEPTLICSYGQTNANCVSLDEWLTPKYITQIPQLHNANEPSSGLEVYLDGNFIKVEKNESALILEPDILPPTVISMSPDITGKAVSTTASLTITFNENVLKSTGNITLKKVNDNTLVEVIDITSEQVNGTGTPTLTITPSVTLPVSTDIFVIIDANAIIDESGNMFSGLLANTDWQFAVTGNNSLFTNYDFTDGSTINAFGDLPTPFIDYSNSYTVGDDARSYTLQNNILTLNSTTGINSVMYNGLRQLNRISTSNTHNATVRYRILENTGVSNSLRVYDGSWTFSTAFNTKPLNTWLTETYDLGVATNTGPIFALYLNSANAHSKIEVDYITIEVQ